MISKKIIKSLNLHFKKFNFISYDYYWQHPNIVAPDYQLMPGDILLMKDGNYLLVGDVNKNMGICDDCKDYEMTDIKAKATLPGFSN